MGTYPPTDGYAKPFYCLTFGLNMKYWQMHWEILQVCENSLFVQVFKLCGRIANKYVLFLYSLQSTMQPTQWQKTFHTVFITDYWPHHLRKIFSDIHKIFLNLLQLFA